MATLTLIADPFPDWESAAQAAAARDLAIAIAETAPRSCSARYLASRGLEAPEFTSPLLRTEHMPLRAGMLPFAWQTSATARPLDGEFVHSLTPLVPLRSRGDDDGSQTSVTITHGVPWEAPALVGNSQARLYRAFVRRAVKLADVILTPTHATARILQEHYGEDLPVQVIQLAPPSEFLARADAADRRAAHALPDEYALTTAAPGEPGRLEWIFDAMRADAGLPPLVVLEGMDPSVPSREKAGAELRPVPVPEELTGRVHVVRASELSDVGAIVAGASVLAQPQAFAGTGYLTLAALRASVPLLHTGHAATEELVLDAGTVAQDASEFGERLSGLFRESGALSRLSVLAGDRSRGFTWNGAAWQLWETHANL
ncbi:Glycosyl transferase, group 1 [Leucobacter sp. 7(1)]|uniref:mannosyltransferase n=1 Tax=Leucobacter sp. 7(1) TaxID=1255613 RepID=UPI00097EA435|nr:mannosyltransferase [Leucobacter sp. 7(1)]SJN13390.1 Glycosyl transferase, group 1 [Leucobacter sp. 7(1)]